MLSGSDVKGPAKRPGMVVLVSHEVAKRGWNDVREGEVCKIPGVGPIAPERAKEIAQDAFLTGVSFDGKDLRNIKRWTRNIPVEVRLASIRRRRTAMPAGSDLRNHELVRHPPSWIIPSSSR